MNTIKLFEQSDVRAIRKIATTFNAETFDPFALEVQRDYLPRILGASLYTDLIENPTDANNVRLLEGEIYTDNRGEEVIYEGLKVYLSYLWIYTFAREGNLKYTEVGISQYQDDNSERAENRSDQDTKIQIGKNANLQGRETIKFLTDNRDDFPLFVTGLKKPSQISTWNVAGRSVARYANQSGFKAREIHMYNFRDIDFDHDGHGHHGHNHHQ